MEILRARFAKDILTEFLPHGQDSNKIAVILGGLPSTPSKFALMSFLRKKNYWSFFPRYRGTWESNGEFLKNPPVKDLFDVLAGFGKPFQDIWSGQRYAVNFKEILLIGSSFGGGIVIAALADLAWRKKISKVVAFSPVTDWTLLPKREFDREEQFLRQGYGPVYRFKKSSYRKLWEGKLGNPAHCTDKVDGSKLLIIHSQDDDSVSYKPTVSFAKRTRASLILVKNGGHFSVSEFMNPRFYPRIKVFLNSKNPSS